MVKWDFSSKSHSLLPTTISVFWTNFSKNNIEDYKILDSEPESEEFWGFQTSLTREDLEFFLSPLHVRRFLFQMEKIYR